MSLLFLCLFLGWLLRRVGTLGEEGTRNFSAWVINVALPAVALLKIHDVQLRQEVILAAATPWIGAIAALVIFRVVLARPLGLSRETLGALILVGGWGNTSFVGIPMVEAYYGPEWLGLVLIIDVLGSYLALSTLGISIACRYSSESASAGAIVRKILTFPPFIAVVIALATNSLPRPAWLQEILEPLAVTLTPIAMAAVGSALRLQSIGSNLGPLALGLTYRLIVAPALIVLMYAALGDLHHGPSVIATFEMAMPPMLGASIIAMRYGLRPELVAGMIGLGIPLSMLTLPVWAHLLTIASP